MLQLRLILNNLTGQLGAFNQNSCEFPTFAGPDGLNLCRTTRPHNTLKLSPKPTEGTTGPKKLFKRLRQRLATGHLKLALNE